MQLLPSKVHTSEASQDGDLGDPHLVIVVKIPYGYTRHGHSTMYGLLANDGPVNLHCLETCLGLHVTADNKYLHYYTRLAQLPSTLNLQADNGRYSCFINHSIHIGGTPWT